MATSDMPLTIRIGTMVYRVEKVSELQGADAEGQSIWLNGRIRYERAMIQVSADVDPQMYPMLLVHEALHGLLEQAGQDDHPETVITTLGYALVQFVRDNPALIRYIQETAP